MTKKELRKITKYVFETTKDLVLSDIDSEHFDTTDLNKEFHETLQCVLEMLDDAKEVKK